MFLAAKEFPLPVEYRFLPLEEVFHEPPVDVVDRTIVFLDCGNIDRMPVDFLQRGRRRGPEHRPPPRQHPIRHRSTSSTPMPPAPPRSSTSSRSCWAPRSRRRSRARCTWRSSPTRAASCTRTPARPPTGMAAELIEAGVDVHDIYRRLYERVPIEKLHLDLAGDRAHRAARRLPLAVTYISAEDYADTGANDSLTEGIIDHVRALEGTEVAAMIRDKTRRRPGGAQGEPALDDGRSTSPRSRASTAAAAIRVPRASRPTSPMRSWSSSSAPRSRRSSRARRERSPAADADASAAGVLLVDKPAGMTSHDVVARVRRERGHEAGPCGHARPVRHGAPDRAARPRGDPLSVAVHGPAEDLPGGGALRRHLDDRRPRRRDHRDRRLPPEASWSSHGRDPPAPSRLLGGQGAGCAGLQARQARGGGRDAASAR